MNSAAENLVLLERIRRGRLVGRVPELTQALTQWQQVMAGEGNVLLVSGEPGVGKTRLIRELVAHPETQGALILLGECFSEGSAPYAPIARILHDSFTHLALGTLSLPDPVLADLVTSAPALRSHFATSGRPVRCAQN